MIDRVKTISLFLLSGLIVNFLVSWLKSNFISEFLTHNLITLLIALVAINTTTLSVVLTKIREIMDKLGGTFSRTAHEMKVSIIEQVVLIGVAIIVQIFVGSDLINKQFPSIFFVSNVLLSAIFFYAIYILFDTANSIFVILEFENDKDTKNKTEDRNEKD